MDALNDWKRIDFQGDDVDRLAMLALILAVIRQAAEDIATMERRAIFEANRQGPRPRTREVNKDRLRDEDGCNARAFLLGEDAQMICDLMATVSYGKVKLCPRYVLKVQVPRIVKEHQVYERGQKNLEQRWAAAAAAKRGAAEPS